jgi:Undecaprenyl-phosphate glucose phosphotransferase
MIKKYQKIFNIMQAVTDALFLLLAYIAAFALKQKWVAADLVIRKYRISVLWMLPLLLIVYYFMNVYTPMRSRMYRKEASLIIRAHFVGIFIINSVLFLDKQLEYSRQISILFGIIGLLLVLIERYVVRKTLRQLRKSGYNQKHLLIIGAGPLGKEFADKVSIHRDFGYNVVGFLDDDETKHDNIFVGKPVLGSCGKLPELLENNIFDEVVVALPLNACQKYCNIINQCEKAGVRTRIIPDFNKFLPGNPKIEDFDGIPLLNTRYIPLDDPLNRYLKRILDITVALSTMLLTAPIMIIVAIGIKLTSAGPVFFRQDRIGLNNKHFNMLKFRSMRLMDDKTAATEWTKADDPRRTKFGTFLRKTSLDELPQLFNVLVGEMSVVGPRPERPYFVEQFKEEIPKYMVKHQVKPGITGWAQANGWRGDTSIENRIKCDIYYIENWDLFFDIKIMFLTIFRGLVNKNAY